MRRIEPFLWGKGASPSVDIMLKDISRKYNEVAEKVLAYVEVSVWRTSSDFDDTARKPVALVSPCPSQFEEAVHSPARPVLGPRVGQTGDVRSTELALLPSRARIRPNHSAQPSRALAANEPRHPLQSLAAVAEPY